MQRRLRGAGEGAGEAVARQRGERAEEVARWYLRLNGVFTIPGFLVHWDRPSPHPRTEADVLGIRLAGSNESTGNWALPDDPAIVELGAGRDLFLLVEVKAGLCAINGPWSDSGGENIAYVIRRMGCCRSEREVNEVSDGLTASGRWEDPQRVVQYLCIGRQPDDGLATRYLGLRQIIFEHIAAFLFDRFAQFPQKTPTQSLGSYWPGFGRAFASGFLRQPRIRNHAAASEAIQDYIDRGSCVPPRRS